MAADIVLYQRPRTSVAASAAAPRLDQPKQQDLWAVVANVASVWAARIRVQQEIREAGRQRRLEQEAREPFKTIRSAVLRQLIQARHKHYSRLDKADRKAVCDYTGCGFDSINQALRQGTGKEQARITALLRAMTKTKKMKTQIGTVFRGAKLPTSMMEKLQLGATFSDPAFLSTTTEQMRAFGGTVLFEIESKTGVDISNVSKNKKEAEVLFRPSTMFMIKAVERGVGGFDVTVKMEELF